MPHQTAFPFRARFACHILCGTATSPSRLVARTLHHCPVALAANRLRLEPEAAERALDLFPPLPDPIVAPVCLALQLRDQGVELDLRIGQREERFEVAAVDRREGVLEQLHVQVLLGHRFQSIPWEDSARVAFTIGGADFLRLVTGNVGGPCCHERQADRGRPDARPRQPRCSPSRAPGRQRAGNGPVRSLDSRVDGGRRSPLDPSSFHSATCGVPARDRRPTARRRGVRRASPPSRCARAFARSVACGRIDEYVVEDRGSRSHRCEPKLDLPESGYRVE